MPRQNVKLDPGAILTTAESDIVSAATAGLQTLDPGTSAQVAERIRDSEGKLTELVLSLPDVGAPGIANAESKILENSGVATVRSLPRTGTFSDWVGFVEQRNSTGTEGGITLLAAGGAQGSRNLLGLGGSDWKFTGGPPGFFTLDLVAALNDLEDIGAYSMVLNIGTWNTAGGWPGQGRSLVARIGDAQHGTIDIIESDIAENANYQMPGAAIEDTGIPIVENLSPINVSVIKGLGGEITVTAGASSKVIPSLMLIRVPIVTLSGRMGSSSIEENGLWFDDLVVTINT